MIKSTTTLRQTQEHKLSPQQIQEMKLLQVPLYRLEERIKEEIEENPALEEGPADPVDTLSPAEEASEVREDESIDFDDERFAEYAQDDPVTYKERTRHRGPDDPDIDLPREAGTTFLQDLQQQARLLEWSSETERLIAEQIIGSISPSGYLNREPDAIAYDLLVLEDVEVETGQVEEVLRRLQAELDPPGVAARNPRECLLLQLERRRRSSETDSADARTLACLDLATRIIRDYYEAFIKKQYTKLQQRLQVDKDRLGQALDCITHLKVRPTSGLDTGGELQSVHVVPDFIVTNRDGDLQLRMTNEHTPQLHVSEHFRELEKKYREGEKALSAKDRETFHFLKEKIGAASWFIDAIKQRQDTLYRTMQAIMNYQRAYFLSGDERKIRPMILKDIADLTGRDISTISRVVNSKWVQTQFGTKLLKDLFSESLRTQDGEEVSALEVKQVLAEIIEQEDKQAPLTDEALGAALRERGYRIARRTVAKYREQLGFLRSTLRKEL